MLRNLWNKLKPDPEQQRLAADIGMIFALVFGGFVVSDTAIFRMASEPVEAVVVRVEEKFDRKDRSITYRPTFMTEINGDQIEYTGNVWVSPKPHERGEIVSARYKASTGEIRSDGMTNFTLYMAALFSGIGGYLFLKYRVFRHY